MRCHGLPLVAVMGGGIGPVHVMVKVEVEDENEIGVRVLVLLPRSIKLGSFKLGLLKTRSTCHDTSS